MTKTTTSVQQDIPEAGANLEAAVDAVEGIEELLNETPVGTEPAYGLRISEDKISVLLDCPNPLGDLAATVARIQDDFRGLEFPEFPDPEILSKILGKACQPGEHLVSFPIIQGWAPTPGQNGRLEWARDFFAEGWGSEEGNESIAFWDQNDQRSVQKGELLARVYHPVPGEPGLDVFCCEIPIAKIESIKLRPGKGISQNDEGESVAYYAELSGRIRSQDGTVFVDDVYLIKGDVSLETGNISHTGTVHIEGDVKTGATIQADGDIMVKGMLEPCNIQCGGSLSVGGGIVGLDEFLIQTQGDVQTMYISGAVVQAGGDITVSNEISHCDLKAYGKVLVPTGRIAGGETVAREGIQVAEAGASGSTATLLVVGVDFTIEVRVAEHEARIEKMEEAQDKIQEALEKAALVGKTPADQGNQLLIDLSAKSKKIGEAIIQERTAIRAELQESKQAGNKEVVMLREVWSGTTIQIGENKALVRSSVEKPRLAKLSQGKVQILPLGEGNMPRN